MRIKVCCSIALLASCIALPVQAQSLRCGNSFVNIEDSVSAVQMKCGAPSSTYSFCKPESRSRSCDKVEEWTYSRPNEFMQTVRFESGRVVSITSGDIIRPPSP